MQLQQRLYVRGLCTQVLADSRQLSFYIDGAHTPESMVSCAQWFTEVVDQKVTSRATSCITLCSDDSCLCLLDNAVLQH